MNVQPPGYNPGESMLQGGNANITAVMGGGGNSNGFIEGNPNDSMLSGGNSVDIVPLKGGKRKTKRKQRGGEYKQTMKRIVDIQHETLQALNPTEPSPLLKILGQTVDTLPEPVDDAPTPQPVERPTDIALEAQKKILEEAPTPVLVEPVVAEKAPEKVSLSEAALKVEKDTLKGFENQEPDDFMSFNPINSQVGGKKPSNVALEAQKHVLQGAPPLVNMGQEVTPPQPVGAIDIPIEYISSSETALKAQKEALKQLKAGKQLGGGRILTEKTITLDAAPATKDMQFKLPGLIRLISKRNHGIGRI